MFGILLNGLMQGNKSDPQAEARRQAEAQRQAELAAERQRQAEADAMRRQEEAKQRILGSLKGGGSSGDLKLKTDSDAPLTVTTTSGPMGSTTVVPVSAGAPAVGGMQLKLGDGDDQASREAQRGFDTSGQMSGARLRPPPKAPGAKRPSANMVAKLDALKALLRKDDQEEKALNARLDQLKQAPTPDQAAISDVQQQIAAKESDKKKVEKQMQDLTVSDPDAPSSNQQPASASAGGKP